MIKNELIRPSSPLVSKESAVSENQPRERSCDESSDARLVNGLKRGDATAYQKFLHLHHGRMFSVAYRFLGDQEEARDCVQDACISIVENIDRFEGRSELSTWVHRIVVNSALARLRRRSRREEVDLESHLPKFDTDGYLIWPTDQVVQPLDRLLEQQQVSREVREAIDALPDDHRDIVLLRYLYGYSTGETARILEISAGAVKVRLHRARSALRDLLKSRLLKGKLK